MSLRYLETFAQVDVKASREFDDIRRAMADAINRTATLIDSRGALNSEIRILAMNNAFLDKVCENVITVIREQNEGFTPEPYRMLYLVQ